MKRGGPEHPKTVMLVMELERIYAAHHKRTSFNGKPEAVGLLEVLWDWCSKYAIQGDIGKWPDDVIAKSIGWQWSGKELIDALIKSRWIDRAPEPHRLVIHDIKDHATNTWRQNLQDAGLTWWDGSSPRKYSIKKTPEKLQNNSRISPQAEPEPEPQAEPERVQSVRVAPADLSPIAKRIFDRHPLGKKTTPVATERALAQRVMDAVNPQAQAEILETRHAGWCASEQWQDAAGRYAPKLDRWLISPDSDAEPPPPTRNSTSRKPMTAYERVMAEAEAEEKARCQ